MNSTAQIIFSSAGFATVLVAILAWLKYVWDRRKITSDHLAQVIFGRVAELRSSLESKVNPFDAGETYNSASDRLDESDQRQLRDVLNYFEIMGVAIRYRVISDRMAYESAALIVLAYWRWAEPYVMAARSRDPTWSLWREVEMLSNRWKRRWNKEVKRADRRAQKSERKRKHPISV